ncbi:cytochrome P450 94B3-like [Zingiber officinale]|uniref:cytochrome P450 94B3-like n=1 Tax=Zingiber officinale TaxID=94328 RepID=UPI001C4BB7D6|nr:cytochrome P450 94B3-like [Zingiber officinale]
MALLFIAFFFLFLFLFLFILLHCRAATSNFYGPKNHPLIGSIVAFYRNRHRLLDWYTDLLAASPSQTFVLRRFGARRTVVTANPANVEHILKTNFPNYPKGRPFTDILGDLLGSGIFNADGDLWLTQRKLASHHFSTRSLEHFALTVLHCETYSRLLPVLHSAAAAVDLQDLLRRFAFDAVCRVSLGTDPLFLHPSLPCSPLADAFELAAAISARRGTAPVAAVWKIKRALGLGSESRLREAVLQLHADIYAIIAARKTEIMIDGAGNDLLSRLIAGGHKDEVVRDMAISFVMAGRDTTSSALTWFFWLMTRHPSAEAEVVEEVVKRIGRHGTIDYAALKEMKILEACLCESMRLYPPVVWDSKHAAADDELPDGTRVRKGDRVTYCPYGMGRMEALWGKTWAEFDHQRWLTTTAEVVRESPYKFAVFQAGPRLCLGKEMAFVQMKYVAAAVLREFKLRREEADDGQPPELVPLLTAHMAGGLRVRVEKRKWNNDIIN